MRCYHCTLLVAGVLVAGVIASGGVCGQQGQSGEKPHVAGQNDQVEPHPAPGLRTGAGTEISAPAVEFPVYRPPIRCAPAGRLAAGTRGAGDEAPTAAVLAPEHVGLTLSEKPVIYWFLSQSSELPIELTLIAEDAVRPIVETRLTPPTPPGIHAFRLSEHDVRLKAGVPYRCFVAIIRNPERRSKDILADGFIELTDCPKSVRSQIKEAAKSRRPFILAEEGLWYDALGFISELIEAAPDDTRLRRQRASLLDQVGLKDAADFERDQIKVGNR